MVLLSKPVRLALSLATLLPVSVHSAKLVLKTAFIGPSSGFAELNEAGELSGGRVFDLAASLKEQAAADGVDLILEMGENLGATMTYSGALSVLDPDCDANVTTCYDFILADYYHTAERSQLVTFPFPFTFSYITTFKLDSGSYTSVSEVNAGGGSVCALDGTVQATSLVGVADNIVPCMGDESDCIAKLEAGDCDLWCTDATLGKTAIEANGLSIVSTEELIVDDFFWLTTALKR